MQNKRLALKLVLITLITFIIIFLASILTQRKYSNYVRKPFLNEKEDIDVLFLGTSHVINGIFPMELWNNYGIVSYNLSMHSQTIALSYWVLKNVLEYTNPELIVLDLYSIQNNYLINESYAHDSLDWIQLSKTKIDAVNDLMVNGENKLEYLFPFLYYHSRWNELTSTDFIQDYSKNYTKEKGAESRINVDICRNFEPIDKKISNKEETKGKEYTRKIIELCKEKDIDILLIYIPSPVKEELQEWANSGYDIAKEYNINYLNMQYSDDLNMNYLIDLYNYDINNSHLNPSGGRKVTDYVGKYICDNYNISDRRNDIKYKLWYDDYNNYIDMKINNLKNQTELYNYLMLLYDKSFSYIISVDGKSELFKNDIIQTLFENIGSNTDWNSIINNKQDYFAIFDQNDNKKITEFIGEKDISCNTSFGKINYKMKNIYLNGNYIDNSLEEITEKEAIKIIVINNNTKEIVDIASFSNAKNTMYKKLY